MSRCCASGVQRTETILAARSRAEIWGQPVAHSLSPTLHSVAYAALGLEARYEAREVSQETLSEALALVDESYLGVSLTMPLKEDILNLVPDHMGQVDDLGAANTVVVTTEGLYLENTDPAGVEGALADAGIHDASHILVLGAGATARSVISALSSGGAQSITIASRDASRATTSLRLAEDVGVTTRWVSLDSLGELSHIDLVASTLPTGVDSGFLLPEHIVAGAALFDVTYHPWPTPLAKRWSASNRPVASGLSMLTHQALIQVRLFFSGNKDEPLPGEEDILAQMKASVGLPTV
jgi:shikimate dehydrogenase